MQKEVVFNVYYILTAHWFSAIQSAVRLIIC